MDKADKKRFTEIMLGVADNFRDSITKPGMSMRFNSLKRFSIEQIEQAALKIIEVRKYTKMPPIAEFVEAIQGKKPDIKNIANIQAMLVIDRLHSFGAGGSSIFGDPITSFLMKRRWPYNSWASEILGKDIIWWVKDFIEAYQSYQAVEMPEQIIDESVSGKIEDLVNKIGHSF